MPSVPMITNVMSSNLVHGEVYSIQHYTIKYDRSVIFSRYSGSSTNKIDVNDITEILLKVTLNTTIHNPLNPLLTRFHLKAKVTAYSNVFFVVEISCVSLKDGCALS